MSFLEDKIKHLAQMSKADLMKRVRAIYFKVKDGLTLEEAERQVDETAPPPPGFPHAWRSKRRAKNRVARASRLKNRLLAKGARV